MSWDPDELAAVGDAPELHITPLRADGTAHPGTPIWQAVVDGELSVRSAHGPRGAWYRRVLASGRARVEAGDVDREVDAEHLAADDPRHAAIDAALAHKYRTMPQYVAPIIGPASHEVTLRLTP